MHYSFMQRLLTTASKKMSSAISVGAKLPAGTLYEGNPGGAVATEALFAGKKVRGTVALSLYSTS